MLVATSLKTPLRRGSYYPPCLLILFSIPLTTDVAVAQHRLEEPAGDERVFSVTSQVNVSGQLEAAVADGKAVSLTLTVDADHQYLERRLVGGGRDARTLRSLRHYEAAGAEIEVSNRSTFVRLDEDRRQIVAEGRREGVLFYSPNDHLTYDELELLRTPGDSLAMLSLLPPKPIVVGGKWTCESWVAQMLSGTEAGLKKRPRMQTRFSESRHRHGFFPRRNRGGHLGSHRKSNPIRQF